MAEPDNPTGLSDATVLRWKKKPYQTNKDISSNQAEEPVGFDARCARCRDAGRGQFFTYDGGDGRVWHFDVDRAARLATENPYYNPRPVEYAGVRQLLENAFHGKRPA